MLPIINIKNSDDDGKMAEIKFKIFINLLEYARDYQITLKHVTVLFSNLTEWLPILYVPFFLFVHLANY